jgi:N-methylhydantoinase B
LINPGTNHERKLAPLSDGNVVKRGDVLRIETGGGGGHGHPFDRPPEKVLEDVLGGFVSVDAASRLYGVAVSDGVIDAAATAALRAKRPATRAFHRHGYVDSLA